MLGVDVDHVLPDTEDDGVEFTGQGYGVHGVQLFFVVCLSRRDQLRVDGSRLDLGTYLYVVNAGCQSLFVLHVFHRQALVGDQLVGPRDDVRLCLISNQEEVVHLDQLPDGGQH